MPARHAKHPCSALQMLAIARAMAVLCALTRGALARRSGTSEKLSDSEPKRWISVTAPLSACSAFSPACWSKKRVVARCTTCSTGVTSNGCAASSRRSGIGSESTHWRTGTDAVLKEAKAVGENVNAATTDLGALRADVETSLRNVDGLINELNRKWPFKRDTELKLP